MQSVVNVSWTYNFFADFVNIRKGSYFEQKSCPQFLQ